MNELVAIVTAKKFAWGADGVPWVYDPASWYAPREGADDRYRAWLAASDAWRGQAFGNAYAIFQQQVYEARVLQEQQASAAALSNAFAEAVQRAQDGRDVQSNQPAWHDWSFSRIAMCSPDAAMKAAMLPGVSAPGAPAAVSGSREVDLWFGQPIEQSVDLRARTIHNATLPGHWLHLGVADWRFDATPWGGTNIGLRGVGTNDSWLEAAANYAVALAFFAPMMHGVATACESGL